MHRSRFSTYAFLAFFGSLLALSPLASAQVGLPGNPFAAPAAKLQYAPDRDYDLLNVQVDIQVDYPNRQIRGVSRNTLTPLRSNVQVIRLNASDELTIDSVKLDGQPSTYKRDKDWLFVDSGNLQMGKKYTVSVSYTSKNAGGRGFGQGGGGWHWMEESPAIPGKMGFWTQGETGFNRKWCPTWDYPNDFATSETRTTVPADWQVIGNGVLVSNTLSADKKTRTFDWKMTIPHATYLLSLVGGPFEMKRDTWQGVQLWYVVPKGKANLIEGSFSDTPDMLTFYSSVLGYKYAWPKYAQDAMYDFGGGMENVSATTLGANSLTDKRAGYFTMASLNSHELAHQWFGDTVTCRDWGNSWLNESFATFMQILYFEHSRGKNAYDREIEDSERQYFAEARRYKRPLSTNYYSGPEAMFDAHTYPKGGVILHTLRRQLGDANFFGGLKLYLHRHQHTPVEPDQLARAFTDFSGINVKPFFDQWIYKPGHPVIDSYWKWNEGSSSLELQVKQTQDTTNGTPIYTIPTHVGVISGGRVERFPVTLNSAEQTFNIPLRSKPDAVLFDPDHEFLREVPKDNWSRAEMPFILQFAPCGIDKQKALRLLLADNPSRDEVALATGEILREMGPTFTGSSPRSYSNEERFPAIDNFASLALLKREDLRQFWETLLNHPNFDIRGQAVRALGQLDDNAGTREKFRGFISSTTPYPVITAAIDILARDADANMDVLQKALEISSLREQVRTSAIRAIGRSQSGRGNGIIIASAAPGKSPELRAVALAALGGMDAGDTASSAALETALRDPDPFIFYTAVNATRRKGDKALLPALKAQLNRPGMSAGMKTVLEDAISSLEGKE